MIILQQGLPQEPQWEVQFNMEIITFWNHLDENFPAEFTTGTTGGCSLQHGNNYIYFGTILMIIFQQG
jgi:hypothetical protein